MKHVVYLLLICSLLFTSCSEYQQILKSEDYDFKYKKAVEYYNAKDYLRAQNLLESVRNIFRGTSKAQTIAYYTAFCSYGQKDYSTAGYLFNNFVRTFPESSFSEECMFMRAFCYYKSSPNPRLDQSQTEKAIEMFQLYINRFPFSSRIDKVNKLIDEMRDKLAYKAYLSAGSYYHREKYKASIIALQNCLKDYPESRHREEIMYMLFNSRYELAYNSVKEKLVERYNAALEEYYSFVDEFPESEHKKDMERKFKKIEAFLSRIKLEE